MSTFLKVVLWVLLFWSANHLTRDILQDVLHVHHPIIDTWHMRPVHNLHWLGQLYYFWGLPIEVMVLALSSKSLLNNEFSVPGSVTVGLFFTYLSFWAWASFR